MGSLNLGDEGKAPGGPRPPQPRPATSRPSAREVTRVAVVDVEMPFGSMVVFMVKWAIASIPAFIILAFFFGALALVGGSIFAALFGAAVAGQH